MKNKNYTGYEDSPLWIGCVGIVIVGFFLLLGMGTFGYVLLHLGAQ